MATACEDIVKVKHVYGLVRDDKSRKIMFFTRECDVHLFGSTITDADKPSKITIHESGRISRYKLGYYYISVIKFIRRLKDQNYEYEYEINLATKDK
jgi:hypothetical protein